MAPIRQAPSEDPRLQRLRPGRNGLGHEQVAEIQRARILAAIVELVAERGVSGATIARIVAGSGVSRRTFYELFKDREDCFVAAFEMAVERASRYVRDVYDPQAGWAVRIRVSLIALLSFLDAEPFMARLLIVESLGAGPRALQRRSQVLAILIAAVDEGRQEAKGGSEPTPLTRRGGSRRRAVRAPRASLREESRTAHRVDQPVHGNDRPALSRSRAPHAGSWHARSPSRTASPPSRMACLTRCASWAYVSPTGRSWC